MGNERIGEIGGIFRTALGLTRHSRIRGQIRGTVELYEMTSKHEALADASSDLATVITLQTNRLLETARDTGRQWNWSSFIISWILAATFGYLTALFAAQWARWWAVILVIICGLLATLLMIAGLGLLLGRKSEAA